MRMSSLNKTGSVCQRKKGVVKASYEVTFLVAKNVKVHTTGESLIIPAAKILFKHVNGD